MTWMPRDINPAVPAAIESGSMLLFSDDESGKVYRISRRLSVRGKLSS